jgi:hypothetical protein
VFQSEAHEEIETGDHGGAGPSPGKFDATDVLADIVQAVEYSGADDDRSAVLIVVEDRNLHALAQLALDLEALRRLDVFEVDAAKGRL